MNEPFVVIRKDGSRYVADVLTCELRNYRLTYVRHITGLWVMMSENAQFEALR